MTQQAPAAAAASSAEDAFGSATRASKHRIQKSSGSIRLQTLARLRWIGVVGQLVAVLGVYLVLGFDLPIIHCLIIIGLSAALNVFMRLRFATRHRLSTPMATALLAYDAMQLAALLYLTGGLNNPFAFLIIAPITVSAASLPTASTLLLGGLTVIVTGYLAYVYLPLPWYAGQAFDLDPLYRIGMWTSVICGLLFMGLYARRLAKESRQMSDALAATEFVLAREQKLHALDGLAAAAAHELGTPLSTIVVVAKELERTVPPGDAVYDDLQLIKSQAQRCREILGRLSHSISDYDPLHEFLPISHLIEEIIEPYRVFEADFVVNCGPAASVSGAAAEEPITNRRPGVIHALTNIVENAQDFANSRVVVEASWTADRVTLTISDDGPGFHPQVLGSLGEPYVTTRPQSERRDKGDDGPGGLGLGFFIAKTLLERSGAEIDLANRLPPQSGAIVSITWQRSQFEAEAGNAAAATAAADDGKGDGETALTASVN